MIERWWTLPGPSAFLDLVEEDMRFGRHVVATLPVTFDASFAQAVGRRARACELRCRHVRGSDLQGEGTFAKRLARAAGLRLEYGDVTDARSFCAIESFAGLVIVVDDPPHGEGENGWQSFVSQLAEASRGRTDDDGGRVCIVVRGETPRAQAELMLSIHRWAGRIDDLDAQMWAAWLLRDRAWAPLRKRLAVAIVSELGGYDPLVGEVLARLEFPALLDPAERLSAHGRSRGWTSSTNPDWGLGTVDSFAGAKHVNSALLAVRGDQRELDRRLWQAQVAVLFPFLEEERLRILERYRHAWRLPFETPWGCVRDPHDLELAHMRHQLRAHDVPPAAYQRLDLLIAARNALAHVEPVRSEIVLSLLG